MTIEIWQLILCLTVAFVLGGISAFGLMLVHTFINDDIERLHRMEDKDERNYVLKNFDADAILNKQIEDAS